MDIQERPNEVQGAAVSPRRWLRTAAWVLPVGLAVLVLTVGAISWAHSLAANRHWPERISVAGRDYDNPAPVSAATFRSEGRGWQLLATVGPDNDPAYGPVGSGLAPTVVLVQTSADTYETYSLMGGP